MKKNSKARGWIQNNGFVKILSIILAIISWFSVVLSHTSIISKDIREVPVTMQQQESSLAQLGLNVIEMETTEVTARINGDRIAVGQLEPEQLTATLQLTGIQPAQGTYTFDVVPAQTTTNSLGLIRGDYEIVSYTPSTIKVKLDRIENKTFPVDVDVLGEIDVEEGYIREQETLTPQSVSISGPEVELEKIDRVAIQIEGDHHLNENYVEELPVIVLDAEGKEIDLEAHHLTLDNEVVQIVISVLKEKEIPLTIDFINKPRNFPYEELPYSMSNYEISVAGPTELTNKYQEILLGFVDISQINLENSTFTFDVKLPQGFINQQNIQTVTVTFPSAQWEEKVYNISEVKLLNQPRDLQIELVTKEIYNVRVVGDPAILETLTSEDLVAELDLAEKKDLSLGQYQLPVKISAPTKGLVWATGEYNVVVQVSRE